MKKKTSILIFSGIILVVLFASFSISGFLADKHTSKDTENIKNNTVDISKTSNNPNNVVPPKANEDKPTQGAKLSEEKPAASEFYKILGVSNKLSEKEKSSMTKWREDIVELAKKNAGTMFINGNPNKKAVALTFDDGPDANITPKIMDVLKKNNIKASFFFIGERAAENKEVVKRADREGDLVLSHSFNHPDLTTKSEAAIDKQIKDTENVIYNIIGKKPALIRPPYGATNDLVLKEAAKNNFKIIIWSIDTLDWSQREENNIVKNVVDNVRPGEIILMHSNEDKKATLEALPEIISELKAKGYSFVTLSELLGVNAYK